jgi:signal transduction histidine kinase/ActR/RegA family two-component response regulator
MARLGMTIAYAFVYFAAAASSGFVAFSVWSRRFAPGGTVLAALMTALALWALFSGFTELTPVLDAKLFLVKVYFLCIVFVPVSMLVLALQYAGYERWITRRNLMLLGVMPVVTLVIIWTNPLHRLFWTEVRWDFTGAVAAAEFVHGPLYWVWTGFAYAVLLAGAGIFLRTVRGASGLFRRQNAIIMLAIAAPWIGNAMYIFGLSPWPHLDTTCLGFVVSGLAIAWGLSRLNIFDIVPVAREAVFKSMSDAVIVLDLSSRVVDFNPAAADILRDHDPAVIDPAMPAILGVPLARLLPVHPGQLQRVGGTREEVLLGDGRGQKYYDMMITPVDRRGDTIGRLVVLRDINDHKEAAQSLQDDLERRVEERTSALNESEEQLRQSQKLEAVGQLAGGIAHDFNNLLTVINGYSDLLLDGLETDDPHHQGLTEIKNAGQRADVLTRQLLAFSRKQILQPEIIDLGRVVVGMEQMLQRLIGEQFELDVGCGSNLHKIKADPGQMGQVVMNLVVNARDAMPHGGIITMRIENALLDDEAGLDLGGLAGGEYVMFSVTDMGVGMGEKTLSHIFEPFYTTKGSDEGTGLGLSTVFGIVHQSGGGIAVESEPDRGSTFRVYFPRIQAPALGAENKSVASLVEGHETVLMVEDEDMIRNLLTRTLEQAGYTVLGADRGSEALLMAEQHQGPIDLMVTDVVMPRMSGYELREQLALFRPETRVLYISGYNEQMAVNQGLHDLDGHFLQKPFLINEFCRKIRAVLDEQ